MYGIAGLLNGRILCGRYRIEAVVGRGGMGAVYRGTDERLGRPVAVKVIGISAADEEEHARLRARFLREARAAAALHHPNVVAVHDFGADDELDLDFLVMELLHGEDLAARLARTGPPPLETSLAILRQAARGLAAGHRAGMVHRDVKPGNLFLEAGDDPVEPRVRVLDFGIAQVPGEEGTVTQLTEYGRSPFSPAYASPEQLRGEDRITAASDVFSLAAVGYHLLTGARPFSSGDPGRMALETANAVNVLDDLAHAAPLAVRDAVARALALDPEARYAHAGELADALAGLDEPRPAPSPVPDPVEPAPRRVLGAVSVEPDDGETRLHHTPPPRRRPAPEVDPEDAHTRLAPPPGPAPAFAPPAAAALPAPREPGALARAARATWELVVTLVVMALFVGSWALAGQGVVDAEPLLVYAGMAASVLLTPAAVHRLTGSRGRYGVGVAGTAAATATAAYYVGTDADPAILLAAAFGLQTVTAFLLARLTRRPEEAPEPAGTA